MNINGEEHSDLCTGIDLGTTNSVLATVTIKHNGDIISKVELIDRAVDNYTISGKGKYKYKKDPTLPSCVFYDNAGDLNKPLVGDFAKTRYPVRPDFVAKSIKSQMGEDIVSGLDSIIPDKTPAEVSARILNHLLREAEKIYHKPINDAVITVPANFDPVMCKATRDAAELAGIIVKNQDGSERPVLLSEPNAVIWDFINQVKNGEIDSRNIIDLSSPKYVMVFDLGGGTLDVTLHYISRQEDNLDILKVNEIATNRYTLLGGDDFDNAIAEKMYERYSEQNKRSQNFLSSISRNREAVMSQLRSYAEELKLDLSNNHSRDYMSSSSGWDDEEDFNIGGSIPVTGVSYDDVFTSREIEEILRPFMGEEFEFNDWKKFESIETDKSNRNIIFPILDVINKASDKLGNDDVKVDAVILNGGMTRFYMVVERLRKFFGFEPVSALDPDQSVARGAAIYHYYLHQYEELQNNMRHVGVPDKSNVNKQVEKLPFIWGKNILNDSLYLGMQKGAVEEIVPAGTELPYSSDVKTGFRLSAGADHIAVPIQMRGYGNQYRKIASGEVSFKNKYDEGAYVAFSVHMSASKIITLKAWTSFDQGGLEKIEEGIAEISVNVKSDGNKKGRLLPPAGSQLKPEAELHSLRQFCDKFDEFLNKKFIKKTSSIAKKIREIETSICLASNYSEFAEPILKTLSLSNNKNEYTMRTLKIARNICRDWSESQRKKLAEICISYIKPEIQGVYWISSMKNNTKEEAILTLALCGEQKHLELLQKIESLPKFRAALVYTYSRTATRPEWLFKLLEEDVKTISKDSTSRIGETANALFYLFRNYSLDNLQNISICETVNLLKEALSSSQNGKNLGVLNCSQAISCILAVGVACACDREKADSVSNDIFSAANKAIEIANEIIPYDYYDYDFNHSFDKAIEIACKFINGIELAEDEEKYLLERLEDK